MIDTNFKKPSILIVEDEGIFADDLQHIVVTMGYDPFAIASSGDEAIACVSERSPDIVIMDIHIQGSLDGIQTAEILKEKFDLPVVYLTANADEATLARAKVTEPHGYLLKPVKLAELRSCIEVSLFKHQMRRSLRQRERWFSTTLRSIEDAVITVDLGGRVTFMNPAAENLIGMRFAEAKGKPASEVLLLVDEGSVDSGETPLDAALRTTRPIGIHEANLLNVSSRAQVSIDNSAAPVMDEDQAQGAVMVFRDVTEKKQLQKRLEFADRLTSLGTMAAGTAHELNNPLAIVVASLALAIEDLKQHRMDLRAGLPPHTAGRRLEKIDSSLETAQSAACRMASIVSNLQTFSRPVQDAAGLAAVVTCAEWAVGATSRELQNRARLLTRFGDVPMVKGDGTRLIQVIINLLTNAAQAIPPGEAGQNEVCVATYTDDRGRAVVEVRDTGSGIRPEVASRIFDPFFTTKVGTGAGLGLSICHGIVSSLGGEITVESRLGKGTTFRVFLPAALESPVEDASKLTQDAKLLPARILAVDDEPMLLELIRRILESEGHQVLCATNGKEALAAIAREESFDIILCDLMMPGVTGMDLYETLLVQDPDLARRIVFVTAGATTAKVGDFLRSVPNPVVAKPFEPKILLSTIQKVFAVQQPVLVKAS